MLPDETMAKIVCLHPVFCTPIGIDVHLNPYMVLKKFREAFVFGTLHVKLTYLVFALRKGLRLLTQK